MTELPHESPQLRLTKFRSPRPSNGYLLVVDDEEHLRSTLRSLLESFGFAVLVAESGEGAVEAFREGGERIACTLLDLTMPGMGGERTLQLLRELRPEAPVILMSGYRNSAPERGPGTLYLQKPFRAEELQQLLTDLAVYPPGITRRAE